MAETGAIAWRVVHLGGTGAWYTTIAVVDGFVITADGRRRNEHDREPGRIKGRTPYTSNTAALEQAQRMTDHLDGTGYIDELDIEPRMLRIDPETTLLDEDLLRMILNDGEVL